jgi:hypothetical protein
MPYTMRKIPKKSCYRVYNKKSKKIFASCTTEENAKKQLRLLRALAFNKSFVPNRKRNTRKVRKTRKFSTFYTL